MASSIVRINASELGLVDLDFPSQAKQFANSLAGQVHQDVEEIQVDLSRCVVLYSCSNEFLDVALNALIHSSASKRVLEVRTSLDYLSESITIYELFRGSIAAGNDVTSTTIVEKLKSYCVGHRLTIRVVIVSFASTATFSTPKTYTLG